MEEKHQLHDIEKAPSQPHSLRTWCRDHQFRTLGTVAAIVIILGIALGVGIGVTVGDKKHKTSSATPTTNITNTASPCAVQQSSNTSAMSKELWQPIVGTPWQIVLNNAINATAPISPSVPIYDIDLFAATTETITQLHAQGIHVICYFSAGSYENWRPDAGDFKPEDLGNDLQGWPGEKWINTNSSNVRNIMAKRIAMAREKSCDAVDPDNIDGFETTTNFTLTPSTALNYLSYLSLTSASHNLSIGLKNAGTIAKNATCLVDFAIVESCVMNKECGLYQHLIDVAKPVFAIEYPQGAPGNVATEELERVCKGVGMGFSLVVKGRELGGWIKFCDGRVGNTSVIVG